MTSCPTPWWMPTKTAFASMGILARIEVAFISFWRVIQTADLSCVPGGSITSVILRGIWRWA